jgi:hypothetical protein
MLRMPALVLQDPQGPNHLRPGIMPESKEALVGQDA